MFLILRLFSFYSIFYSILNMFYYFILSLVLICSISIFITKMFYN